LDTWSNIKEQAFAGDNQFLNLAGRSAAIPDGRKYPLSVPPVVFRHLLKHSIDHTDMEVHMLAQA
jgi:hypothetical protein